MNGYFPAMWPAEDGGPRRLQHVDGAGLGVRAGELTAISRPAFGGHMVVQRDRGELFFQGAVIGPESTAWVERIDPSTLEPHARVDDLPAGPWWPGGILAHANGDLYVTQGRWCHRLRPDLSVVASRELPRGRPYNSLLALPDGSLVMKDMSSDDTEPSQIVVLDPDDLTAIATHDLDEGSIARLSADGEVVCVVGMQSVIALRCAGGAIEETARVRYRTVEGQTFGWDAVLDHHGSVWFLDNGEGTAAFSGSFVGQTSSSAPLHLVRADWPLVDGAIAELHEVCGEPGGIIANPPMIVEGRDVVIGYDSGHGAMTAWRGARGGELGEPLWRRAQNHASHVLIYPGTNEVLTMDYDLERGIDQCVVLDIETGDELGRVDTGSPVQSVVFPCPGWERDAYLVSLTTLTRVSAS
jgi:hypothetical protein